VSIYIILLLIILLAALLFRYLRKSKKQVNRTHAIESMESDIIPYGIENIAVQNKAVDNSADEKRAIPDDLKELYGIILTAGGRITQKDIRKKLPCSEAKVSLMLDDLEERD